MFTPGKLNNGGDSAFGYGLRIGTNSSKRQASQTGEWAGSGVSLVYFPDQKFGLAVLANWDYTPIEGFAPDIINIYMPAAPASLPTSVRPMTGPKSGLKVGPAILDRYTGTYRLGPGQIFLISRQGNQLFLGFSGQKFPLTTQSETEFSLDFAGVELVFKKNSAGKFDRLVWSQGGIEQVAPKVVLIKPTPMELREFAGAYLNEELNLTIGIELRGSELVLIPSDQAEVRLSPDEKDHFVSGDRSFPVVIFQRDSQDRITGFIIDADSIRDLIFKKK
jgi:hypothetical protein